MKILKWQNASASFSSAKQIGEMASSGSSRVAAQIQDTVLPVINNINHNVFDAVDDFMYLNKSNRLDGFFNLSGEDKEKFLSIISKLLKEKVIGYEKLEVDGAPEKHFMATQLGNRRLYGAKRYDERANTSDLY